MPVSIANVLTAIESTRHAHNLTDPAPDEAIATFASIAGVRLPVDVEDMWRFSNGASLMSGGTFGIGTTLYPIEPSTASSRRSILSASDELRDARWPIPPEFVPIGDVGGGEYYGLWRPALAAGRSAVIEIGSIFEQGCMGIAGESFAALITARMAAHIDPDSDEYETVCGLLAVPESLRNAYGPGYDSHDLSWAWANPSIPAEFASSYEARLESADVNRMLGL